MRVKDQLRYQPADATDDEEARLQVVGRVVDELDLFERGHKWRPHDRREPLANVVRMAFGPTHALTRKARKRADALGRGLGPRRVHDLVALGIELERELPVFGDARAPADFAQDVRADHVRGAG